MKAKKFKVKEKPKRTQQLDLSANLLKPYEEAEIEERIKRRSKK